MQDILLTVKNRGGSVEHYYHFLLGFLLPLASKLEDLDRDVSVNSVIVRSCGPMDRHITALNISKLVIIDAKQHAALRNFSLENQNSSYLHQTISGFDDVRGDYEIEKIKNAVGAFKRIFFKNLDEQPFKKKAPLTKENRQIVLIKRDKDNFYNSGKAEIPTSGSQRRSIENFPELQACIEAQSSNLITVTLEKTTLSEQISLFSGADIIIAQHGAALANLVWSSKATKVIEIAPKLVPEIENCFSSLSRRLGLGYRRVLQEGLHGKCDLAMVKHLLSDESIIW